MDAEPSNKESTSEKPQVDTENGSSVAAVSERSTGKAAKVGTAAAKKKAKEERAALGRGVRAAPPTEADDPLHGSYGDAPLVQSSAQTGRVFTRVNAITPAMEGQKVLLRARVHNVRGKGGSCFLVLRQQTDTVQCVMFADDMRASKVMVKYASALPRESIVDVEALVVLPEKPVKGCTLQDVELHAVSIKCISRAHTLPFELADASRREEQEGVVALPTVGRDKLLDHRFLDLRTRANLAIFRVQSAVCQLFRECLLAEGFIEIHTPKLQAGSSEGGAGVFRLDYMGRPACLAQSPQLHKQMAICADMERVFEIGPVFRAERSDTHRHLCEFTGLDLEMAIHEHYNEVLDVLEKLFMYMFDGLKTRCAAELAAIQRQFPFTPIEHKPLRLEFPEGIKLLQQAGIDADPMGDLTTANEKALGALVKEKYGTDVYILTRYPIAARPFYTMPCPDNPLLSNSYDVFIRGGEIISGAQRIHDPDMLVERASACGIEVSTIQSYVDAFKLGAPPHGGAGAGLERVVMLYAALGNIRRTSMFPRDPNRLTP